MTDDRFEDFLREAAQDYHRPPATPREKIWARVEAAREEGTKVRGYPRPLVPSSRRLLVPLAIAAILALGVAIGRLTVWRVTAGPTAVASTRPVHPNRSGLALEVVTAQHLSRVDALLTELKADGAGEDFAGQARGLLATTRLLLDSRKLTDPKLRGLLEDLETILVQVAQLAPEGRSPDRVLLDEGMAERRIRSRLRNAIPAGPAARIRGEV